MATVEGLTKARMLEIEAASVVDGEIDENGHLILTTHGGTDIDAGNLMQNIGMIRDVLYPVGSIYMSTVATNPGVGMGGTWVAWGSGRVPVGFDAADTDFNASEKTGGAKTHTLTAAQSGLPSHNHTQQSHNHTQNAHNHTQNAHAHTTQGHSHGLTDPGHAHGQYVTANPGSGGTGVRIDYQGDSSGLSPYPQGIVTSSNVTGISMQATGLTSDPATAGNQAATAVNVAATAVNNANTATDASAAHNIQQKFITCYMWKRTA